MMHPPTMTARLVVWVIGSVLLAGASVAHAQQFPEPVNAVELPGEVLGDNFGKSVAGIGDVDSDGFDDIAIGAPFADSSFSADGKVFLYFGGASFFDAVPDLVLSGLAADDHFGISVAGGIDLNNDGFDDVAVGARFSDLGAVEGGAVFVHFGGPNLGVAPPLQLIAEAADDWFGQSVRSAGDVNNDGFGDLIVGAPYNDANANAAGRAYVFFGGAPMDATADVTLQGAAQANSHFGWSVAGAGDVNGDGFGDVIIGARLHGSGPTLARGRAYVFLGGAPMDATADVILEGEAKNDWFGESVAGAGDVNNDGFADVLVGAIFADPPTGSAAGKGYLFFGSNPMDTVADLTFDGPHADAQLGNAGSGAGDVNGDGFDDVILGAHFATAPAGTAAGQAFVLFGGLAPDNTADLVLSGAAADDQFGEAVASAGVVAAGSGSAFLAGAHFNDTNGNGAGMAYVFGTAIGAVPALSGWGVVMLAGLLMLTAVSCVRGRFSRA